jgi:hypothetical protein
MAQQGTALIFFRFGVKKYCDQASSAGYQNGNQEVSTRPHLYPLLLILSKAAKVFTT